MTPRARASIVEMLRQTLAERDADIARLVRLQQAHRALLRYLEGEPAAEVDKADRPARSAVCLRVRGRFRRAAARLRVGGQR
jgi:hypothetical protein